MHDAGVSEHTEDITMELTDLKLTRTDIVRFDSWSDTTPEDLARLSYGDLKTFTGEPQATDFYRPSLLSGSDYAGDSVTVSNHRVFLEKFKGVAGVYDVYGGYSTYAVAIRLDAITEDMMEVFNALEDYLLIDEEDHSEVEMESENESWDSYAREDFRRAAIKKFPEHEERIEALEDGDLFTAFHELTDRSNTYWVHETGNFSYIDIDRVIACAVADDFLPPAKDGSVQLPLPV